MISLTLITWIQITRRGPENFAWARRKYLIRQFRHPTLLRGDISFLKYDFKHSSASERLTKWWIINRCKPPLHSKPVIVKFKFLTTKSFCLWQRLKVNGLVMARMYHCYRSNKYPPFYPALILDVASPLGRWPLIRIFWIFSLKYSKI